MERPFISQVPEAFQTLISRVTETMKHALEVEEKVPLDQVTNFNEVGAWGRGSWPIIYLND